MDLENVWTVAKKDFSIFRKKKSIMYSLVALPLGVALGLPAIIWYVMIKHAIQFTDLIYLVNSFAFFFIIVVSMLPVGMASYSIVGEKVEKSLEPLLATPATDGEILFGKSLAAFLPSIGATYFGYAVFMVFIDAISRQQLGYLFYPNWTAGVFLLLAAPFVCLFSIELNVIISARVNDVRAANQSGGLVVMPFAALYVSGEIHLVSLNTNTLLIVSAVLLFVDALLFFVSRSTFRREEILTKWK
jgi:ABC-type Na+ efflux pump permease subunit